MAPKSKISKDEIIDAALCLVERLGKDELNARSLAKELGISTQPIFSNFENMADLKREVGKRATSVYLDYISETASSGLYPEYKASGMAYIRFAKEKRELFKLVFMDGGGRYDAKAYYDIIDAMAKSNGISAEDAIQMHIRMWTFVHGIATMAATEFLDFDDEYASKMITDVYNGLILKYKINQGKNV